MSENKITMLSACLLAMVLLINFSCSQQKQTDEISSVDSIFTKIPESESGVSFNNVLHENHIHNQLFYDYYLNGGGVALADINNDGLTDIYFTGNTVGNKLYLNRGNLTFEDITGKAQVAADSSWCTGATMVDINSDGFMDIYVSRSYVRGDNDRLRRNLLYINNGDLTFSESAAKYGLDDPGYSIQSTFFDYDLDGDLDMFLANHGIDFRTKDPKLRYKLWKEPKLDHSSDKLYRNEGDLTFTDVTKEAGLYNYDYTLGVVASDINEDGFPDLYLANDYEHPDRYLINNGNGTFTDNLKSSFKHTSFFGMGIDVADINNDSRVDVIELDMASQDHYRSKTQMSPMNIDVFWLYVDVGYHYQFMRNSLQLNRGDGYFSDIGQMAGIAKTDWSWSVLAVDVNNDGWKDFLITNGYRRDSRFNDFANVYDRKFAYKQEYTPEEFEEILSLIPSEKLSNYLYINNGDYTFTNKAASEGLSEKTFSHGASYADLDNDGDLELIINNQMDPASIYKNNSIESNLGNFIQLELRGEYPNLDALGAKVSVKTAGLEQYIEQTLSRGYQSSVDKVIHFGLGQEDKIESIKVEWQNGKVTMIEHPEINKRLVVDQSSAKNIEEKEVIQNTVFQLTDTDIDFEHKETYFDDFQREILLPHKMSEQGPALAVSDVNNDGQDDLFIGGAHRQPSELHIQNSDGSFNRLDDQPWLAHRNCEDFGATFFDADNDGDMDLYVVSGSNEWNSENHPLYRDRLYYNDGEGKFTDRTGIIPKIKASGSCVKAADFDGDGFLDLFVGGRQQPGNYPHPGRTYLLRNNQGKSFTDVTKELAPEMERIGMVTDAVWMDIDKNNLPDLIICGEWMPLTVFQNSANGFKNVTTSWGLGLSNGWWNKLTVYDFDADGDKDLIGGNLGLNYKYKASTEKPFPIYSYDFDDNGTTDIVLGYKHRDNLYPVRGRECSSEQMPVIADKFPTFHEFGKATLRDIYGENLEKALSYNAYNFASSYIENTGSSFLTHTLPMEAQFSPVNGIELYDVDKDGNMDLILAGNLYGSEIETGRADGGVGVLLLGNGDGSFQPIKPHESGLYADKDVKDIRILSGESGTILVIGNNNDKLQVFRINSFSDL